MSNQRDKALSKAVSDRAPEAVLEALRRGANIDRVFRGLTPLNRAIITDVPEIVELLLRNGASPDARDKAGFTALHWASMAEGSGYVQSLIQAGADVNAADALGHRPMDTARAANNSEATALLLSAGAVAASDEKAWLKREGKRRQATPVHSGARPSERSP